MKTLLFAANLQQQKLLSYLKIFCLHSFYLCSSFFSCFYLSFILHFLSTPFYSTSSARSLKDRRASSLLPTTAFFRSSLTPRFHRLRRRRRPASAQRKPHQDQSQQQQKQREKHQQQQSISSDPNFSDILPSDVDPGENVTDSRERLRDGTACDEDDVEDDDECKERNEDDGGHPGDSSDLKAASKKMSHSAPGSNIQQSECRGMSIFGLVLGVFINAWSKRNFVSHFLPVDRSVCQLVLTRFRLEK